MQKICYNSFIFNYILVFIFTQLKFLRLSRSPLIWCMLAADNIDEKAFKINKSNYQ